MPDPTVVSLCPNGAHCSEGRHEFEHQRDEQNGGPSWLACASCDVHTDTAGDLRCMATGKTVEAATW